MCAEIVKNSLFHFIRKFAPTADLSLLDEIVLDYVVSNILESNARDAGFAEGFIEMISGFIPEFSHLNPGHVNQWVGDLQSELSSNNSTDSTKDDSAEDDKISLTLQSLSEMLPSVTTKTNRSHSNSESSEGAAEGGRRILDSDEHAPQCQALHEMFPNTCSMEIKHCVSIAHGDVERAAATLLHRREQGQALSPHTLHSANRQQLCDDSELKNRIIARYSYVDKNSDTKEHKPLAPKIEPKKMVRYRDNKIVSLKGERYTEVPKSGIDEEHLKKPKKQHCP